MGTDLDGCELRLGYQLYDPVMYHNMAKMTSSAISNMTYAASSLVSAFVSGITYGYGDVVHNRGMYYQKNLPVYKLDLYSGFYKADDKAPGVGNYDGQLKWNQGGEELVFGTLDLVGGVLSLGELSELRISFSPVKEMFKRELYEFSTKALGEMGEEATRRATGAIKPRTGYKTSAGLRYVDGKIEGMDKVFESKVGFQGYRGNIVNQVDKDADLVAQGFEVTWVFWRSPKTGALGASDELLQALTKAGIKYEIKGDLPKDIIKNAAAKYGATKIE